MKLIALLFCFVASACCFGQSVRKKTYESKENGTVVNKPVYVIPFNYDQSEYEIELLQKVESLCHRNLFVSKIYYVTFNDDTGRFFICAGRTSGIMRLGAAKFFVGEFFKNGNAKNGCQYDRKFRKTGFFSEYYKDGILKISGEYRRGEKKGKWTYFNNDGLIVKKERYRRNKLISTKEYPIPQKSVVSAWKKKPSGVQYILK